MPETRTITDEQATGKPVLTVLAFAAIYLLWGSTFLSIRIAVETVPPLFAAGVRFFFAGAVLYTWSRLRGASKPTRLEWRNVCTQGALLFLIAYSGIFYAEKTVPSGITAVLVSMIPLFTAVLQISVLRKEKFRKSLGIALIFGPLGVAVLAFDPSAGLHLWPCLAVLVSETSWSVGTALSKVLLLPKSMPLNAGAQMLAGGSMLLVCSALFREWPPIPHISLRAGTAILYLSVAGSIVAFTAYVWLLDRMPATIVTSYAYVNPVVALIIGHFLGNEVLGLRTWLGTGLVLLSVVVALRDSKRH